MDMVLCTGKMAHHIQDTGKTIKWMAPVYIAILTVVNMKVNGYKMLKMVTIGIQIKMDNNMYKNGIGVNKNANIAT